MARMGREREREERDSEFVDKLVHINRVAKVVKGGRRFGFAALVVVGDQKGRVGFGHGKAREVPEAIRKATDSAKRGLVRVPLREGRTLHHDVLGRHGAGKVFLRAAPPGTGIIAGGPMRAVFETLGMQDVVAKSIGSSNPYNMVRATFDALKHAGFARVRSRRAATSRSRPCRRDGAKSTASRRRSEGAGAWLRKRSRSSRSASPIAPASRPARDADRPRAQQDRPGEGLARYADDQGHDHQGQAPRARGREVTGDER